MATTQIIDERELWLAERKLGIGGSDAAAVFSEGYGCARALYYDKSGTPVDFERTERENLILRRGTRMEEMVAEEYSDVTGRKIRRTGSRVSKLYPFMRVNIDRQILNDSRGPGVLEVKTASPWVFAEMKKPDPETGLAKGLPHQYILQMHHAFAVTGYKWGAFAVMNMASWELLPFEIEPNQQLIDLIIEREKGFWVNLQAGQIPEQLPKSNDRRCANCQWRKTCRGQAIIVPDEETEYVVDDSLAELGADYKDALEVLERDTALAEEIKARLQEAVGDRAAIIIPSIGYKIRYKTQQGSKRWDTKALQSLVDGYIRIGAKEVAGDDIEKCRKPSAPTRPFFFIKDGELA